MAEPPPPSKREEAARRAEEIEGIDKRGVEMWLVKVPGYLMEEWERLKQEAGGEATTLGKLVLSRGVPARRGQGRAMHLQCDGLQPDKPERYEMRQSQQYAKEPQLDNPGIHILSEVSDRKELEALYADHDPSKLEELRGGGGGGGGGAP